MAAWFGLSVKSAGRTTRVAAAELPEPREPGLWQLERQQSPAPRTIMTHPAGLIERRVLFADVFMAIGFQPLAAFVFGHFFSAPFLQGAHVTFLSFLRITQ